MGSCGQVVQGCDPRRHQDEAGDGDELRAGETRFVQEVFVGMVASCPKPDLSLTKCSAFDHPGQAAIEQLISFVGKAIVEGIDGGVKHAMNRFS